MSAPLVVVCQVTKSCSCWDVLIRQKLKYTKRNQNVQDSLRIFFFQLTGERNSPNLDFRGSGGGIARMSGLSEPLYSSAPNVL